MVEKFHGTGSLGKLFHNTDVDIPAIPGTKQSAYWTESDATEDIHLVRLFQLERFIKYGSMFQHMANNTIILTNNVFEVVTGWTVGETNGTTITNTQEVTVGSAGHYHITWTIGGNMAAGSNQNIEFSIFKNGAEQDEGCAFRRFQPASDIGSVSGVGMFNLAANDVMDLRMNNTSTGSDFVVECANFDVWRMGV